MRGSVYMYGDLLLSEHRCVGPVAGLVNAAGWEVSMGVDSPRAVVIKILHSVLLVLLVITS
jgi:hypothetical protein